jgi:hypothetical protein
MKCNNYKWNIFKQIVCLKIKLMSKLTNEKIKIRVRLIKKKLTIRDSKLFFKKYEASRGRDRRSI